MRGSNWREVTANAQVGVVRDAYRILSITHEYDQAGSFFSQMNGDNQVAGYKYFILLSPLTIHD